MFKSLSRTVTCTGEMSASIRVIPREKRLSTPLSRLSYLVMYTVLQLSKLSHLSMYLVSVRYLVLYVLDAHDD